MFFHKKLGWLTPNNISSPTDSCLSPSVPSCLEDSPCLGSRTPPVHKVFRMAGLKPPASVARGPLAGLSSPVPNASGTPIMLMSCLPCSGDFNPWIRKESAIWKERNIFTNELPNLSGFLTPLPVSLQPSPLALQCQPDCTVPPCPTSFPLCHDPCGSLCVPWATQPIQLFPCGMQLPLASNCASMMPCTVKFVTPGPCATKGASLCNTQPPLASKCASPLPCTTTCPYCAKYANGIPCTMEILPASSCASPVSCATKGTILMSPCGTKGAHIHPCDMDILPAPNCTSPTSCAAKGATIIPCATKGGMLTSPCGTKCANFHPCDVDILPVPNCTSPVSCATKGMTTIPCATKGATSPCACATKCVSAIPSLPQCACPVPCATENVVVAPHTPSWPILTPCTPNSCYKAPAFTVPQVVLKWAGNCGISCPNIGTLSLSQTCPPLNNTFTKK